MAMRLSGLISGMDTESMVSELMKAQRLKTTKIQNKITTTEWKQEKWSALNTKLYSFYTGQLSKLRMQGSFAAKKTSSSNANKVEVSAGANAPEGTHLIKVKQLASSQFVTGAKLGTDINGNEINVSTKLKDVKDFGVTEGTTIQVKTASGEVNLDIRENTTVGDLIESLRNAGLNANYDTAQKRFFISSKASGAENAFELTAFSSDAAIERNEIREFLGYDFLSSADKSKVDGYFNNTLTDGDREIIQTKLLEIKHGQVKNNYINSYMANQSNIDEITPEVEAELRLSQGLEEGEPLDEKVLQAAVKDRLKLEAEKEVSAIYDTWKDNPDSAPSDNIFEIAETKLDDLLTAYKNSDKVTSPQDEGLKALGLGEIKKVDGAIVIDTESQAKLVNATDAIVTYNGAKLTGSSNNFSANGLTFTLKDVTTTDETISLNVSGNTQAVYDMVKDFVKTYNELLKDMNDSYNAKSARGYEPISDEDRQAMTDDQIEKYEAKIKDSLLRRDDTLGGLISVLRSTLSEGVSVDGKKYTLASFGVTTQNYTEKGLLHINGDADDATTAVLDNKLMEALNSNPDQVMEVMTKLGEKLYGSLMKKMETSTLSSALTVYNDKEITKTLTSYKSDLAKMEAKLTDIENRYFKQFTAMETAMAKMNSQSSALMSMLGMGNQK